MYLRDPEFWLLVVGCLAAAAGIGAWIVVPLLAVGLIISGLPGFITAWPTVRYLRGERDWFVMFALSMFNNLAVACVVYIAGAACRWGW